MTDTEQNTVELLLELIRARYRSHLAPDERERVSTDMLATLERTRAPHRYALTNTFHPAV